MAFIHMAGLRPAGFLIVHIYMTTTGHSIMCHFTAMCTGWEEVADNGAGYDGAREAADRKFTS